MSAGGTLINHYLLISPVFETDMGFRYDVCHFFASFSIDGTHAFMHTAQNEMVISAN